MLMISLKVLWFGDYRRRIRIWRKKKLAQKRHIFAHLACRCLNPYGYVQWGANWKRFLRRWSWLLDQGRLGGCRHYFFRGDWSLGLPQVVVDGHGIHTGWHGLGWYLTELLLVWVVLVEPVYHLARDALGPDARQFGHLFCFGAVRVESTELATCISEQNQEVVGLGFVHFLLAKKKKIRP